MKTVFFHAALLSLFLAAPVSAQVTVAPLLTFGLNNDGSLAPGENAYLTTGNTERGLAYSATTNHLYFVSRETLTDPQTSVRILDAATGVDLGFLPDTNGIITGGFFTLNMIGAGADGVIYAANLRLDNSPAPYKVYRWETEISEPTVAFEGEPLPTARLGDSLDVIGSGVSTLLAAGYNVTGTGYAIITPSADPLVAGTSASVNFQTAPPPQPGDFRLGLTFGAQANVVIGNQGTTDSLGIVSSPRVTTYSGTTGTLSANPDFMSNATERPMDFAVINGLSLLATLETTTSAVRIYDLTDPASPIFLTSVDATTTDNPNAFGVGSLKWGAINGGIATLYALNTNNGIQAYQVTVVVPEPSSVALLLYGAVALACRSGRRSSTARR